MNLVNEKEGKRFVRFAIVGTIGAIIDFGVFNILTIVFSFPSIYSSIFSFLVAVISNFLWNRHWTYPEAREKPISHQMFQFFIVSAIGLGIRTPLFAWLEKILINFSATSLPDFFLSPMIIGHNISLATAIFVVLIWNFIANRYWTYSDVKG
jgi:putative flippase GtrA